MKNCFAIDCFMKVNYVFVTLTFITSCVAQQSPIVQVSSQSIIPLSRILTPVPTGRVKELSDVYIRHFINYSTRSYTYHFYNIRDLLTSPSFDFQKPTVIYCHGFTEVVTDENIQILMGAYAINGGYNALLLDWSNLAFGNYVLASYNMKSVAVCTARAIMELLNGGLSLESLHLIGHSLGAALLTQVCEDLSSNGIRIRRFTCLDAAFPGFYPPVLGDSVSPLLADFVDAIHSDGGKYGTPVAVGHADFWPNGGTAAQPGCPTNIIPFSSEDFCSHWRSVKLWAESILGGHFLARRCSDYDHFLRGNCTEATTALMGLKTSTDVRGNFYLKTAAAEPFALGEAGLE